MKLAGMDLTASEIIERGGIAPTIDGGFASKVHKNEEKRMSERNTELDVLVTVNDCGAIGVFDGRHTKASERLFSLYPDFSVGYEGKVSVFVDALVDSGHLLPVNDTKGIRQQAYARGLTPKGLRRIYELEHPVRAWIKANWFPFVVACVTTCVGVASTISSFIG